MAKSVRWTYALVDGVRVDINDACREARGICPLCGAELVAKKGEYNAWHWAHIGRDLCDDWYQPKGPWHRFWQRFFPESLREVPVERDGKKHIADIKTINGIVVEVQWSPIAIEEIREREQFYDRMIWIVAAGAGSNNKRLFHFLCDDVDNRRQSPCIWRTDDVFFERVGWLHCGRPVFVDVDGTQDSPASGGDLYYILPNKDGEGIFVAKVRRNDLIDALRTGMTKNFFLQIKEMKDKYIEGENAKRENEIVRIRAESIENRQKWELEKIQSAVPFFKYSDSERSAIAFANKEFHLPPRCAVTLGWVEAFLIMEDDLRHITISPPKERFAPYGRVAVHLNPSYTKENYEQDCRRARKMGILGDIEEYDVLKWFSGKIVGCVDYLVKHVEDRIQLTFNDPIRFLSRDEKAWTYKSEERSFWILPEKTQEYLQFKDLPNRVRYSF